MMYTMYSMNKMYIKYEFGEGTLHLTRISRHLEDDVCGQGAAGSPGRYMKPHAKKMNLNNLAFGKGRITYS